MSAGKQQGPPTIGMNSIAITTSTPPTFEETYNELMHYTDLFEPFLLQFGTPMKELMKEEKETTMLESPMITNDKQIEEVKMLSEKKNLYLTLINAA
jgi:hypothetical protein